eukprot:TRINITY_DN13828_c0_g1_i6.p1 TRINITY_DN13828_c0_g1~~TRINITY_DN13828_c0_g1_i6.p1  ORF type:complete len:397 (+),score=84.35 TRINITY_DN13828_c0_g1_i6:361-1551(+)
MISDCGKGFVLDAISELAKQVKDQGGPTVQGVVTAVSSAALSAVFTALDWGPVLQAIRSFGDRSPGVVSQVVAALKPHFDQVRSDIAQGRVDPVAERAIRLRIEMELDLRQPRMEAVVSAMTEFLAALENAVQRFPFEVMPLGQKLCGVALASIYTLIDRERDVAPDRAQWPVFAKQLRHIVGLFAKAFELMFDTAREVFKRTPIHPEATFAGRVADEMGNRLGTTSTSMFEAHANRVLANGCPRLLRRQDQGGESGIEWRLANEFPEGAIPLEFAGVQGLGQQVGEFSRYARELARWGSDPQKPKGVQSEPAQRWRGRMHELGVEESRDSVRKQLVPFIRALDNMLAANTLLRVEHSFAFSAAAAAYPWALSWTCTTLGVCSTRGSFPQRSARCC